MDSQVPVKKRKQQLQAFFFASADRLSQCRTFSEVTCACDEVADQLGYSRHQLTSYFPDDSALIQIGNFPTPTCAPNARKGIFIDTADPLLHRCWTECTTVYWDNLNYTSPREGLNDKRILEAAQTNGLTAGISVPVHFSGAEVSILSFAGRIENRIGGLLDLFTDSSLHVFAQRAHTAQRRIRLVERDTKTLTPRELECLRWIACGKTSWETAKILGVSESTVIFHLRNSTTKLGATNRPQAVAKALMCSLLSPFECVLNGQS